MSYMKLVRIDESNFLKAFDLKLNDGQEKFVSHPIRSLAFPEPVIWTATKLNLH